jgi:hypothetical protein
MLLVGADKQAGGKGGKTKFNSGFSRLLQAKMKAIPAALVFMPCYPPEIFYYVVAIGYNQWKIQLFCQGLHCLKTSLMLTIWMYVRVIP